MVAFSRGRRHDGAASLRDHMPDHRHQGRDRAAAAARGHHGPADATAAGTLTAIGDDEPRHWHRVVRAAVDRHGHPSPRRPLSVALVPLAALGLGLRRGSRIRPQRPAHVVGLTELATSIAPDEPLVRSGVNQLSRGGALAGGLLRSRLLRSPLLRRRLLRGRLLRPCWLRARLLRAVSVFFAVVFFAVVFFAVLFFDFFDAAFFAIRPPVEGQTTALAQESMSTNCSGLGFNRGRGTHVGAIRVAVHRLAPQQATMLRKRSWPSRTDSWSPRGGDPTCLVACRGGDKSSAARCRCGPSRNTPEKAICTPLVPGVGIEPTRSLRNPGF